MATDPTRPAARDDAQARASLVMERCDRLARFSEEPDRLTRRYGTAALREARETVAAWLRDAGMTVRRDAVGNLLGRSDGADPAAKTLLLGSHLDSVRDAGRYDGPLGVLVALAAVERLHLRGERLPFAVELLAFADEEGLRFGTAYLGSGSYTGALDPAALTAVDDDGVRLGDAIRAFGGDPDAIGTDRPDPADLLGYLEVHIEQGPTLEALALPVGIVSAIAGRSQIDVAVAGVAGHAGTVAMPLRRDALCAAAELVLAVEERAHSVPGLVATVGRIAAEPCAANVIPGRTRLTIDVRHADDAPRREAVDRLRASAAEIAARRRVDLAWDVVNDTAAVACDPALSARLETAVEQTGHPAHRLPSGAGHDPVMLAPLTPVAMLFVRCAGGVSHNPAEAVAVADVAVAIEVVDRFLVKLEDELLTNTFHDTVTTRTAGALRSDDPVRSADEERDAFEQGVAEDVWRGMNG